MSSILPINLDDLLYMSSIESARVEFKASWDEKTTGPQIIRTICAFANDFQNLNGGYIVLGVAQQDAKAVLPPKGLTPAEVEAAQNWIRGRCNTIDPVYPAILSPEVVEGRHILVVWAPGSQARPHQAPDGTDKGTRKFYIRLGASTVDADAQPELKSQLIQLTARVPFDDRRAQQASIHDISETKVREFLHDIRSGLVEQPDTKQLYRNLRIAEQVNGHDAPKNIGLLFFNQDPGQWFPGARIDVVQFAAGDAGDIISEKIFEKRPIHEQLRDCVSWLDGLSMRQIQKIPNRMEAAHWVSYPALAMREALANAIQHRSYEREWDGATKVYLYPDRMEIISYPGPVPGLELHHLETQSNIPPVQSRNRRIAELLKELRLAEGRGTGIPKLRRAMAQNGSPPPRFEFDAARSYFKVTLPAHPGYQVLLTLQDVASLKAVGDTQGALLRLKHAWEQNPGAQALANELLGEFLARGDIHAAKSVYEQFSQSPSSGGSAALISKIAGAYLDRDNRAEAILWLDKLPLLDTVESAFEAAIQEKRAGRLERAHKFFAAAGDAVSSDVKALHEFAQVKIKLANKARPKAQHGRAGAANRLLDEAREMLQRVVQMEAPRTRHAWAWYDLGCVLQWRKAPMHDIRHAFEKALGLDAGEIRFKEALARLDGSAKGEA
jgi:ATP-dependent DNA helicase RecG